VYLAGLLVGIQHCAFYMLDFCPLLGWRACRVAVALSAVRRSLGLPIDSLDVGSLIALAGTWRCFVLISHATAAPACWSTGRLTLCQPGIPQWACGPAAALLRVESGGSCWPWPVFCGRRGGAQKFRRVCRVAGQSLALNQISPAAPGSPHERLLAEGCWGASSARVVVRPRLKARDMHFAMWCAHCSMKAFRSTAWFNRGLFVRVRLKSITQGISRCVDKGCAWIRT